MTTWPGSATVDSTGWQRSRYRRSPCNPWPGGTDVACRHRAGIDSDAHGQRSAVGVFSVQRLQFLPHQQSGADGPLGVVGLGDRCSEHRDQAIAHVLVQGAVIAENQVDETLEDFVEGVGDLGGRHVLRHRGESAEIAKTDAYHPFLGGHVDRGGPRLLDDLFGRPAS